ncbi:MAG: signal peptidase II [Clostridia bacterium]|nr:signal peptidase II [Clostridia bacterium]
MFYFILGLALVAVDILTKISANARLQEIGTIPLIEGVFHLTYVENRGAAFGILQNQRWFFLLVAMVFAAALILVLTRYKNRPALLNIGLCCMAAGAFGNTIDRIWRGFVVDFFDFRLIDFPVFNVADICVCVGAGLLAIFFVFCDRKEKDCVKDDTDN